MDYKNKRILVCGIGKSGIAAANLLYKNDAIVSIWDSKVSRLPKELENKNISFFIGEELDFDVIILSPGVPYTLPFVKKALELGIYVIGEFELGSSFYNKDIYAITGTNGKTTTTMLTSYIFSNVREIVTAGNIGIPITQISSDKTCIAEVSSFQLETIDKFKPKIAAIINITPDHLDRHFTMENYINMKAKVFQNQNEFDYIILNHDNEYTKNMSSLAKSKVVFFTLENNTILFNENENILIYNENDFEIISKINNEKFTINIKDINLVGKHNIENIMVSSAIALIDGIDVKIIENAIKSFKSPEHRIEYVEEINGIKYYNDSKATNPESSIKSIEALSKNGNLALIAGGRKKDVNYEDWANIVKKHVAHIVIFGEDSFYLENICKNIGFESIHISENLHHAVKYLRELRDIDIVLFSPACASFDMFKDYEDRGKAFKSIVLNM
ncbi:MAG: UDP-N-acetylmuramoyl-L-alanine--D-glutamate ligase [Defluviitaleaceae bacterium]|nr:UDP-N-acetylmuramoyl-L-alanine--D-glutamate ligase [Defluviitaleaceae bacterium]